MANRKNVVLSRLPLSTLFGRRRWSVGRRL